MTLELVLLNHCWIHESYNGSEYCEPYSGIATSTTITINDIESLERENDSLQKENYRMYTE